MSSKQLKTAVISLFLIAGVVACNGDEESDTDTGTQSEQDASVDTGQPEDTGTDTVTLDTGSPEEDTTEQDTEPAPERISRFYYKKRKEQCDHSCTSGISVSLVRDEITEHDANSFSKNLESADAETLKKDFFGESTLQKMKDGWDCGDATAHDGEFHLFEATLGTAPNSPEKTQNISGCIPMDSTEADAQRVQEIAQKLETLGDKYFQNQ